ncbi:hypothetical protein, unlikely [Trypanosoma congolense IL3000]|uniref:Uncharacterized protein n=1 Tax=Trypanosoma congolense (strain IL3000) TaxID=1068625 RepID=F9W3M6_TRYCI|nr:hypothetical protein, unlikely [Trypanosoma congolense IL3000]
MASSNMHPPPLVQEEGPRAGIVPYVRKASTLGTAPARHVVDSAVEEAVHHPGNRAAIERDANKRQRRRPVTVHETVRPIDRVQEHADAGAQFLVCFSTNEPRFSAGVSIQVRLERNGEVSDKKPPHAVIHL